MIPHDTIILSRFLIGFVFAFSVFGKMQDIRSFQEAIDSFRLLPLHLISVTAWAFLACESIVLGLVIIGGRALSLGFLSAALLLALFSVALMTALIRKLKISCNCFGPSIRRISYYDPVRNMILILISLLGWAGLSAGVTQPEPSVRELLLTGCMAASLALILMNLGDIIPVLLVPPKID